jgi:hypothetical protein
VAELVRKSAGFSDFIARLAQLIDRS